MSKNKKNRTIEVGAHDTVIVLRAEDNDIRVIASDMNSQVAVDGERIARAIAAVAGNPMAMTLALAVVTGKASVVAVPLGPDSNKDSDCDGDCVNCNAGDPPTNPADLPN